MNRAMIKQLDPVVCAKVVEALPSYADSQPERRYHTVSSKKVAAWLRFPSLALELFEQTYTRTGETTYRFESGDGEFTRELTVNDAGLVVDYPGLWRAQGLPGGAR